MERYEYRGGKRGDCEVICCRYEGLGRKEEGGRFCGYVERLVILGKQLFEVCIVATFSRSI